jgi:hypothetical protein
MGADIRPTCRGPSSYNSPARLERDVGEALARNDAAVLYASCSHAPLTSYEGLFDSKL